MRRIVVLVALALVGVPSALAAKPSHPATPANSHANGHGQAAKVMFVLRGTLGTYTAANGTTNGSIAITVKRSNHESALLDTQTLTFPVSSTTKVVGTVTLGHNGIVKVRAPKNTAAATLETMAAFQVIDQGKSS